MSALVGKRTYIVNQHGASEMGTVVGADVVSRMALIDWDRRRSGSKHRRTWEGLDTLHGEAGGYLESLDGGDDD